MFISTVTCSINTKCTHHYQISSINCHSINMQKGTRKILSTLLNKEYHKSNKLIIHRNMAQDYSIPFEVDCFIWFTSNLVCMSGRIDDTSIVPLSQWQLFNWTIYKKLIYLVQLVVLLLVHWCYQCHLHCLI